jgi:hypothetical protein
MAPGHKFVEKVAFKHLSADHADQLEIYQADKIYIGAETPAISVRKNSQSYAG